jgi:RimJ/RimL family protein N-acetyltransferase
LLSFAFSNQRDLGASRQASDFPSVRLSVDLPNAIAATRSSVPLEGPIATGTLVSLGWPEPAEYDLVTALRNRPAVRACFLDSRPLDPAVNREWLACGMKRPWEGLLAVRIGPQRVFCGTVGWSGYEPDRRTFEIGRLMVDAVAVRPHRASFPVGYPGVGVDASLTLLRFAFEQMGVDYVTSVLFADRALARRVNLLAGAQHAGDAERERPDGSRVRVSCMRLTRERWIATQARSGTAAPATPAGRP